MAKAIIQGRSVTVMRLMWLVVACASGFSSATLSAETSLTLDFAKGMPAGGVLREMGQIGSQGLGTADSANAVRPGGFALKNSFALPAAFRLESDAILLPGEEKSHVSVLWDDMYIAQGQSKRQNCGMQIVFRRNGTWMKPIVSLAIDGVSCESVGPGVTAKRGLQVALAVTYDANGYVTIEMNGEKTVTRLQKKGPISPAPDGPVVGDRVCGPFGKFEGVIRRLNIIPIVREPLTIMPGGRLAFQRGEEGAELKLKVGSPVTAAKELRTIVRQIDSAGREVARQSLGLKDLGEGEEASFVIPVETRLKPGALEFAVRLEATDANGTPIEVEHTFKGAIGSAFAERMTAFMWKVSPMPYSTVAEYGFTHGLGPGFTGPHHPGADTTFVLDTYDKALSSGLKLAKYVKVQYPPGKKESDYYRLGRDGKPSNDWHKKPVPEVSNPEMIAYARKGSEADVEILADHPAFGGALAVSENRDHTFPSYNTEQMRYRAAMGVEPPVEAVKKVCDPSYAKGRFADGVVPEDDPVLRYYRWFWNGGDGWPDYLSAIADGYREAYGRFEDGSESQRKHPFFTFHDPAVRCPAVWGSGGSVDVLSQWCYANPEPMNVAGPIEEMFAMAEGRPGQQVMAMTQLICYRSQMAPKWAKVDPLPDWVKRCPNADFPTIPPDLLQEATWSMIAKPVRGIMYHGWACIYETGATNFYVYTNGETSDRIKHLLKDVVAPIGPSLLKIGRDKSDVAILESGTTAIMGGPASWGWTAPSVTFLQRARLDPRVVYEEAVERGALKSGVKVLYAPQLQYTTPKVASAIRDFQADGGILIGDRETLKALTPDIVAPVVSFSAPPASDHADDVEAMERAKGMDVKARSATVNAKRIMQRQAEEIRARLAEKGYRPASDSSSSEIVVFNRRWRDTRYLFAINDKRTFGDYVGPWGRTMEKGMPFEGRVTLAGAAKGTKAVYELSRGGQVSFFAEGDNVVVPVKYETNDGRLFVFLPEPIAQLNVEVPPEVPVGGRVDVMLSVRDQSGCLVPAVLPVEVRLYDSAGVELDGAGYAAAENGVCRMHIQTNLDDAPGEYRLVCRDRASGLEVSRTIRRGERPWWKRLFDAMSFR